MLDSFSISFRLRVSSRLAPRSLGAPARNPTTRTHVRLLGPCFKTGRTRARLGLSSQTGSEIRRHRTPTAGPRHPTRKTMGNTVKPRRREEYRPPTRHAPHRRAYSNHVRSTTAGTPASLVQGSARQSTPLPGTHLTPSSTWTASTASQRVATFHCGEENRTPAEQTWPGRPPWHARTNAAPESTTLATRPTETTATGSVRRETESSPTRSSGLVRLPPNGFTYSLNSLFKVLFNFTSRYLFAIGLVVVFSLRWSLPPA